MWGILKLAWLYKTELVLLLQFLAALRKTAKEVTQDYIRRQLRQRLRRQLAIVSFEIILLVVALWITRSPANFWAEVVASCVLWLITLYNAFELFFRTIPEIRLVHQQLKGKVGYALKYVLQISVFNECMRLNVIFLMLCLVIGISTRTFVGSQLSFTKPWNLFWSRVVFQ